MKIRSITVFCSPGQPLNENVLGQAAQFIAAARPAFQGLGYEVQTARLVTPPYPLWLGLPGLVDYARQLYEKARLCGYEYLSLGPALPEYPDSYAAIPEVIAATRDVFFSGSMTDAAGAISLPAVRACAEIIWRCAGLEPNGFANLRFAALANVGPGSPFLPAAYHRGEGLAFALATEAADLAVEAFRAPTVAEARSSLLQQVEQHAAALEEVGMLLEKDYGAVFGGVDFSLAPFPDVAHSSGAAMEALGVARLGEHGSLAAAALLAEAIDQAQFKHAGFSGLMLPVLEDTILAQRAAQGSLTVKDLLLYSAVCGTGLDTVPLPGDVTVEALQAVLLDVAVLACRLDKPLTARLMPIPGKQAGEATNFDFAFFANSKVMALDAGPLQGAFANSISQTIKLRPRHIH